MLEIVRLQSRRIRHVLWDRSCRMKDPCRPMEEGLVHRQRNTSQAGIETSSPCPPRITHTPSTSVNYGASKLSSDQRDDCPGVVGREMYLCDTGDLFSLFAQEHARR